MYVKGRYVNSSEHVGDVQAIQKTVNDIDELFHHIEEDLESWTRQARYQYGDGDVKEKVEALEAVIHHLMFDVGVTPSHDEAKTGAPGAAAPAAATPPGGKASPHVLPPRR